LKLFSQSRLDNDIEPIVNEVYDSLDTDSIDGLRDQQSQATDAWNNKALKYCVIASVALHLVFFASIPMLTRFGAAKSFLKPGDQITPVRLVEANSLEKKPEPPPEMASAISDRNHTAEKQRLPRVLPSPRPPLGNIEPAPQRLAALPPPMAPEDLIKPKEEKSQKEDQAEKEKQDHHTEAAPRTEKKLHKAIRSPAPHHPARKNDLMARHIDLRPTPAEIAKGLSASGSIPDFHPDGTPDEPIIDINTREVNFFSYLQHLKQKIQAVWIYPSVAARAGIGGSLLLEFSISKEGKLLGVTLLDSSGHTVLDESAMRAIRSAAPFYPFPPRLTAKRIRIRANFVYITGNSFRNLM
jgi:TonB family protein